MMIGPALPDRLVRDHLRVVAKACGDRPARLGCDGHHSLAGSLHRFAAEDEARRSGVETISSLVNRDRRYEAHAREADGSDADATGA